MCLQLRRRRRRLSLSLSLQQQLSRGEFINLEGEPIAACRILLSKFVAIAPCVCLSLLFAFSLVVTALNDHSKLLTLLRRQLEQQRHQQ